MTRPAAALLAALAVAGAAFASMCLAASATNQQIERVSVTNAGAEVHGLNSQPAISGDGRVVVFASDAPDVVPNSASVRDIFVRDRQAGTTEFISVAMDGSEGDGPSIFPGVTADGRYVVFESQAGDLVPVDQGPFADVFVRDRQTNTTRRVNLAPDGSETNDDSLLPAISRAGHHVVFTTLGSNLVPSDINRARDVYIVDLISGTTELVSVATDGTHGDVDSGGLGAGGGRLAADGRFVAFGSFAGTLATDDNNNKDDIFVRDRTNGTTERVSIATDGEEGNDHSMYPTISEDGRYVPFFSLADNLVPNDHNGKADIFVRDRQTGETKRISGSVGADEANGASRFPDISSDGHFVVFSSEASNLVPDDSNGSSDIFRYDMETGATERVSVSVSGEAHGTSTAAVVNADGSAVAFQSLADDLIPADDNLAGDVFVWGKPAGLGPTATPTRTPTPRPTNTPTQTPQRCPPPPTLPTVGDVNTDGHVNSLDALLVLQYTANLLTSLPNEDKADVNGDGRITSIDAFLLLQFQAGLIHCLPP